MRILVAAIHYPVASGRYIARALARMGHDVKTIGPCTGNDIWGMTVDPKHIWQPTWTDMAAVPTNEWKPDLVITADSAFTIALGGLWADVPHVLFGVDNHVRDYRIDSVTDWDIKFLAHSWGARMEDTNTHWLPCAYDPVYFTPSRIPMAEREYDVCMIGVGYPRRVEIIQAMQAAGLKVFAATGLLYEEYAAAYHNSRISLCVSAAGDVAQRVFETAAMGCVLLTDDCPDLNRLDFWAGAHGVIYESAADAVHLAQSALGSTFVLEKYGRRAIEWSAGHTWDARAQTILDKVFSE